VDRVFTIPDGGGACTNVEITMVASPRFSKLRKYYRGAAGPLGVSMTASVSDLVRHASCACSGQTRNESHFPMIPTTNAR
jgi:hypothetical protein